MQNETTQQANNAAAVPPPPKRPRPLPSEPFAKFASDTTVNRDVPRKIRLSNGAWMFGDLTTSEDGRAALSALGFRPLDESPAPETPPPEGAHYEARYAEQDGRIIETWAVVAEPPPPPRTFSKHRIVAALMDACYWPQVKAYIEGAGLWDLYLAAQTFREDDPHFAPALAALKTALAVPDETVESILTAAAVD